MATVQYGTDTDTDTNTVRYGIPVPYLTGNEILKCFSKYYDKLEIMFTVKKNPVFTVVLLFKIFLRMYVHTLNKFCLLHVYHTAAVPYFKYYTVCFCSCYIYCR